MIMVDKGENVQNSDVIDLNGPSKLLSICMFGRDDDYMLDFRYRITTTINHLARSIKNLGQQDKVEILVTDWGSHVPMAHTLELSPEAAEVCRFIYVPPEVIRATQEGRDDFHTTRASNVAIWRACGKYIMVSGADTLIQEHSLAQMLRLLSGEIHLPIEVERTFFMIPRFDVPWQFLERRPNLEEWDRCLLLIAKNTPIEPTKWFASFGGAGALMIHRRLWHELRGLDESLSGWGWSDEDLGLRVSQRYPFLSLSILGILLYHMGHSPTGRRQSAVLKANPHFFNPAMQVNDEDWGFGNIEMELQRPQKICILPKTESTPLEATAIDPCSQSLAEIMSKLTNNKLVHHLKRISWLCLRRGWVIDCKEINALFFLYWYSLNHYPRRYLEFSSGSSGAVAVTAACPSVEIYKTGHWEGIQPDDSPGDFVAMLDAFQFRGYVRFVNGDISTAIQRLKGSFVGHFGFDLMLVGGKMVDEVAEDQVCNLISYLSPGGALILNYSSTNDFMRMWCKIKNNYSQYTYFQCADQKTGMVLAAQLRDYNYDQDPKTGVILFDTRWFTSTRIKEKFLKILIKLYRRAIRLFRLNL